MSAEPEAVASPTRKRGPRGPYAKSAGVRRKILAACVEAFSASGFHGATMKEIAHRAGISQTGLMHHFPDKAELLLEVLHERDRQMRQQMEASAAEHDFFHSQLEVVRDNERRPGLLQLHTMISAEATDEHHPVHDLYRERYDNLRQHLEALLDESRAAGTLTAPGSSRALANLFVAALDGLQLQWLYNPDEVDVAESLGALVEILDSGGS